MASTEVTVVGDGFRMHPHGNLGKDVRINRGLRINLFLLRSYGFILYGL